jgi:hypothetical protein
MAGGRHTVENLWGPGDRRDVPIEFFKLPKCKRTFRGGRIQFGKTSWVAFPFGFGFGKGGPLFALCVVADLQVGAFALRRRRSASLKTGHYKIEQQENAPSPVPAPDVATGLNTRALLGDLWLSANGCWLQTSVPHLVLWWIRTILRARVRMIPQILLQGFVAQGEPESAPRIHINGGLQIQLVETPYMLHQLRAALVCRG